MKELCALAVAVFLLACPTRGQKPELVVETGHTNEVTSLAFSPKGKIVASVSADGTIGLWDIATGHELTSLGNEGSEIHTVAFSPDGTILASGAKDIKLWDVATGRELRTLKSSDSLVVFRSLAFSPDGRTLASGGERWIDDEPGSVLRLWDVATGVEVRTLNRPTTNHWQYPGIRSVAFSPDGKTLLSADGDDHTFRLWSTASGAELTDFVGSTAALSVAFNRNGKTMASGGADGTIKLWDAATGRELANLGNGGQDVEVAFSPDGTILASGAKDIKLWDVATGRELRTLEGSDSERVNSIAFSPDGRILASGGYDRQGRSVFHRRPVLRLWDLATKDRYKSLEAHGSPLESVAVSPDGTLLASGGDDKSIKIWNLTNRNALRTLTVHNQAVLSVAFSTDATTLASGSEDGTIKLWDVATGRLRTFGGGDALPSCCIITVSADGSIVASTSQVYTPSNPDSLVRLWDVRSGQELPSLHGPIPFRSIALTPDGETLAAADERGITLWNVGAGRRFLTLPGGWDYGLTFSPDGKILVSASVTKVTHVWDVATGHELRTLNWYGDAYTFSPDGRTLALAAGPAIKLYELASGRELRTLVGHDSKVSSITFQKDGRFLFSGSVDGSVRIWDPDTGTQVAALFALDQSDWAVVDPLGRFDASPGGMHIMHYAVEKQCGAEPISAEPIDLDQLKNRYWEPGLLSKIINKEPLRDVRTFDHVDLYPDVQLPGGVDGSGKLNVKLTSCGGGIGQVQVFVNTKQFIADARGPRPDPNAQEVTLPVDLKGAPVIPGEHNEIRIVAWNAQHYLHSRGETLDYFPNLGVLARTDGHTSPAPSAKKVPKYQGDLYAIIVGISHYDNKQLDLTFPSQDAESMAKAIQLAGGGLLGCDHVHIFLLSTEQPPAMPGCTTRSSSKGSDVTWNPPTKTNLAQAFLSAGQARPQDVLVVYFSGHGISFHDTDNANSYAFPTADATVIDPEYLTHDIALRAETVVTSDELASWVAPSRIAATRQVLILDTCAAGAAAAAFSAEMREIPGDQIRALDTLAENSGFHLLMGSAADAVSYEASPFGQGLLTYALLQGMKGPALKNDVDVDVATLFEYAVDTVPNLARTVGIQQQPPQPFAPLDAESFPIGELSDADRAQIPLAEPKPVILGPRLLNAVDHWDNLVLEPAVREALRDKTAVTSRGGSAIPPAVFVDAEEMPGAIRPSGTYTVHGNEVTVELILTRDSRKVSLTIHGPADNITELATKIATGILEKARMLSPVAAGKKEDALPSRSQ